MNKEKKIIINIDKNGNVEAETFGIQGTACMAEIDKLMKDLALVSESTKKPEYFKTKVDIKTTVKIGVK